jgi:hypothetical protein
VVRRRRLREAKTRPTRRGCSIEPLVEICVGPARIYVAMTERLQESRTLRRDLTVPRGAPLRSAAGASLFAFPDAVARARSRLKGSAPIPQPSYLRIGALPSRAIVHEYDYSINGPFGPTSAPSDPQLEKCRTTSAVIS